MPKCPKCNAPINHLRAESRCSQEFSIIDEGEFVGRYNFGEPESYDDTDFFFCPECYEQLFEGDEIQKAAKFLQSDNLKLEEYEK